MGHYCGLCSVGCIESAEGSDIFFTLAQFSRHHSGTSARISRNLAGPVRRTKDRFFGPSRLTAESVNSHSISTLLVDSDERAEGRRFGGSQRSVRAFIYYLLPLDSDHTAHTFQRPTGYERNRSPDGIITLSLDVV